MKRTNKTFHKFLKVGPFLRYEGLSHGVDEKAQPHEEDSSLIVSETHVYIKPSKK